MTETLITTSDNKLALTVAETELLQKFLVAHDRGGFYMVYNAMTDSAEASLQSRIATFSGDVGGAALTANRLAQVQIGPGTGANNYPGMYFLSQKIAESAYVAAGPGVVGIVERLSDNAGLITDIDFFNTAKDAWSVAQVLPYFPGNLVDATLNAASSLVDAFVASFQIQWGAVEETQKNTLTLVASVKTALEQLSAITEPGAWNSIMASLVYERFGKQTSDMTGYQQVSGPNGHTIYVDSNGHVGATFASDLVSSAGLLAVRTLVSGLINAANPLSSLGSFFGIYPTFADIVSDALADIVVPQQYSSFAPANFTEFASSGVFNGDTQAPIAITNADPNRATWAASGTANSDAIYAGTSAVEAGNGNDIVIGGTEDNDIFGGAGNDILWGRGGNDDLIGDAGDDVVRGGQGDDTILAGQGNDIFDGGDINLAAKDDGRDTVSYQAAPGAVTLYMSGAAAGQGGTALDAQNKIIRVTDDGSGGADTLHSIEIIKTGNFNDTLNFDTQTATSGVEIDLGAGNNTVKYNNGPAAPPPAPGAEPAGPIKINFTTTNVDGSAAAAATTNTITIDASLDAEARSKPLFFVDGQQIAGGASFVYDMDILTKSSGNVNTNNAVLLPYEQYPTYISYADFSNYLSDAVAALANQLGALSSDGSAVSSGAGFAVGLAGVAAIESLQSAYINQSTSAFRGYYGEQYAVGPEIASNADVNSGAACTLTVHWVYGTTQQPYNIVINNWHQGDFGINLTYGFQETALDSGTNFDGELTGGTFNNAVPLSQYQQELAAIGYGAPAQTTTFRSGTAANPIILNGTDTANAIAGTAEVDLLKGFRGNDTLNGSAGNDIYFFRAGDGSDTISDTGGRIIFQDGVTPANVTKVYELGTSGFKDILVTYTALGQTGTIRILADGSDQNLDNWTFETTSVTKVAPLGTTSYAAWGYNLTQPATDGKDYFKGTSGNDMLGGGKGNDVLEGSTGSDTYVFNIGDGQDKVIEDVISFDTNVIQLGAGITPGMVTVSRASNSKDMILTIGSSGDQINFKGMFEAASSSFNVIRFADGVTVWKVKDLFTQSNLPTALDQTIYGDLFDNQIAGGAGTDRLIGGKGNDTYLFNIGDGRDTVADGGRATDTDTVLFGSGILPQNVSVVAVGNNIELRVGTTDVVVLEGLIPGGSYVLFNNSAEAVRFTDSSIFWDYDQLAAKIGLGGQSYVGTTIGNTLTGSNFADTFDGLAGNDTLRGGAGGDTYLWRTGAGNDTIYENVGVSANDKLVLEGVTSGQVTFQQGGTAAGTENDLIVRIGANFITVKHHFAGGDLNGIELIQFGNTGTPEVWNRDRIADASRGDGKITIKGTNFVDNLVGTSGADHIIGLEGNDLLAGGTGADTYVIKTTSGTDIINDGGANVAEIDIVQFDTLIAEADVIVSQDSLGEDFILTNTNYTVKTILDGRLISDTAGADQVNFSASGASWTYETLFNKSVTATTGDDIFYGDGRANSLVGGAGNDQLLGRAGDDTLDGGEGIDQLEGGAGNDTFLVDNTGDEVVENTGEGIDTIQSSVTRVLAPNVENLMLTGVMAIDGTGNATANILIGNSAANALDGGDGNDTLDGSGGADTLRGGFGDDIYRIDALDTVVENAGEGSDTIETFDGYTLAQTIERLTLLGTAAVNGTGNDSDNVIKGNAGNNMLDGGLGNDTMVLSGTKADYTLDPLSPSHVSLTDTRVTGGDGVDIITNFENFQFSDGAFSLAGLLLNKGVVLGSDLPDSTLNGLAAPERIFGFAGNDMINGGGGSDTLFGGAGDDTFVFATPDPAPDTIVELLNEGTDLVRSTITVAALAANVENLTLEGTVAINGTGNILANIITGNSAINTLSSGGNVDSLIIDTLIGKAGNDIYIVDSTNDVVTEVAGEGTDTVNSAVTFTLPANVENLILTGTGAISGTGNVLANTITGNIAANTLNAGNNTAGTTIIDTLIGKAGNDIYVVDSTNDVVTEVAGEGTDTVNSAVTFTLSVNVENLTLTGTGVINGTGNAIANTIVGNSGNNILNGGGLLDTLSGGLGNDFFVFNTASSTSSLSANRDSITDFNVANDTIRLENTGTGLFTAITTLGTLASTAFTKSTAGTATTTAHRIIYDTDGGQLYYDADGSGAGARIQFASVAINLAITNADFVII
jgi:Ca2+-binding RTX toxin-like protein